MFAAADAYDSFMGRYSTQLAPQLADLAGVEDGQRVLDVGCGTGILTAECVRRGATVAAVDPSEPFVAAVAERHPGVDVRQGEAEALPFPDGEFDAALAQLVVHFMREPVTALREMGRVTRPGGVVGACVWDHAGGQAPVSPFWHAVREVDPDAEDESQLAGARQGHLEELLTEAGLVNVEETALPIRVEHPSFDDWWEPFTLGVGPAGAYLASLDPERQTRVRDLCRAALSSGKPVIQARAWVALGRKLLTPGGRGTLTG
jgi:SAM-dependent methyltransferase